MTVAQVIIDIPAQQTNRPFDYLVPPSLTADIQVGMRVLVPFGTKLRQGFVIQLQNDSDFSGKLKTITRLLDLKPVLSPEMLALAHDLAQTTQSFMIRCLQVMLPNALNAKYRQQVLFLQPRRLVLQQMLASVTLDGNDCLPHKMSVHEQAAVLKAQRQGLIRIQQLIAQRGQIKYTTVYRLNAEFKNWQSAAQELPSQAHAQIKVLSFLSEHPLFKGTAKDFQLLLKATPTTLKTLVNKQFLVAESVELHRLIREKQKLSKPKQLTDEQQQAVTAIVESFSDAQPRPWLLEGVTGSGKTEVYLHCIQEVLNRGQQALFLVPEIGLTAQMVQRVTSRFGQQVAVLHSRLSIGERYDEWRRIERQEAQVVIGARSAIFSPLQHLGLIILDEEHDASYKQEEMPRYHTRNVAIWRSHYHHCPVILGSATPSLESRARAEKKRYQFLRLTKRPLQSQLPQVKIVDLKESEFVDSQRLLSQTLMSQLQQTLDRQEQAVLLLNRRGYAAFLQCRECGTVLQCPNCDISLTVHQQANLLQCHYCGFQTPLVAICPHCHSDHLRAMGVGTEQVEKLLAHILPQARVIRMDVDTTRKKNSHQKLIDQFMRHDADILLGTQMVAKGLDFPLVTLVGVINADTTLNFPDFRAGERTFQLLTQVSGRAGRGQKPGQVIIQTYNPENYAIQLAAKQDYETFFRFEMGLRHRGGYPPYYFTTLIKISALEEDQAAETAFKCCQEVKQLVSAQAVVLGPTPPLVARINQRYYYQILIKYKHEPAFSQWLSQLLHTHQGSDVQISIDQEPLQVS